MRAIAAMLLVASCSTAPAASAPLAAWDPVDPAFAGCHGACGHHVEGPTDDVVAQPGPGVGQRTYCPVSGAVFTIEDAHPSVELGAGTRLHFCCEGCATYFEEHRDDVLAARGIALAR